MIQIKSAMQKCNAMQVCFISIVVAFNKSREENHQQATMHLAILPLMEHISE